jgi:aryl-alcohol dehydrogenase-like predicted oxidoreductase
MRRRPLGKTGITVSEIGFGAWAIGGMMWGGRRDEDSRRALRRAVDRGVDLIDTALVYGSGHSERLVGELLKEKKGITVATKVPPKCMTWPAAHDGKLADYFPAGWIQQCAETSLKNLGVDTIDVLQLHVWADAWTDEAEWHDTLMELKRVGKVRAFGLSLNSHDPASALRVVRAGKVDTLQVFHNIFDQSPEDELFPLCLERGVGVLSRVPFDEGSLTGKLTKETKFPEGDFRRDYFAGDLLPKTVDAVEKMRPIVEKAAGTMARGALRYCLSHPAVSTVIPGMRSDAQVDENCAAGGDGPLPPDTLAALRPFRWVRRPH